MNDQIKEAAEKYAADKSSADVFRQAHVVDFIAGAEYALSLPKEPEWVSVETELPEESRLVLVFLTNGSVLPGRHSKYIGQSGWSVLGHHGNRSVEYLGLNATHWMLLPSPPKELTP